MIFATEKAVKELEGKVDAAELTKATELKDKLKSAVEANNINEIKTIKEELNNVVQNLTMKMYEEAAKAQQSAGGTDATGASDSKDDNVVDAEFEEVKDDEKK